MALNRQPDLFLKDVQPDMLEAQPAQEYRADPDKVRKELNRMLTEARAAQVMRPATVKLYRTLFPQMSNWLPKEEAQQLCFAFDTEMERLKAA